MTAPSLYDPFARLEGAKITGAAGLANHVRDYYCTAIVEMLNDLIIDCETKGRETIPLEGLRVIAAYVATMPLPTVTEIDEEGETH